MNDQQPSLTDINTEGGVKIDGSVTTDQDFINGDLIKTQINVYDIKSASTTSAQPTETELEILYHQAFAAHMVEGDLVRAQELYEQVKRADPSYPGINRVLKMVENESHRSYIDMGGRVVGKNVMIQGDVVGRDSTVVHQKLRLNVISIVAAISTIIIIVLLLLAAYF